MEIEAISSVKNSYRQQDIQIQQWQQSDQQRVESGQPVTTVEGTAAQEALGNKNQSQNQSGSGSGALNQQTSTEKAAQDIYSGNRQKNIQTLNLIYDKVKMGSKLTDNEKNYLRKYDPVKYRRLEEQEEAQKAYESDLSRATSEQDVRRAKFSHPEAASRMTQQETNLKIPDDVKNNAETEADRTVRKLYKFDRKAIYELLFGSDGAAADDDGIFAENAEPVNSLA